MNLTIRQAGPGDLRTVWEILHHAADWLHRDKGLDQWPHDSPSLTRERLGQQIARGDMRLIEDGPVPVGTIALSLTGDPELWTEAELEVPALYLAKTAVVRSRAGRGIGAAAGNWCVDYAWRLRLERARLDAWKTNTGLQDYYRRTGWKHVRTVDRPHRNSGALFERPAEPSIQARMALREILWLPDDAAAGPPGVLGLEPGAPVLTAGPGGEPRPATYAGTAGVDATLGVTPREGDHGAGPGMLVRIRDDAGERVVTAGSVWPGTLPSAGGRGYSADCGHTG